jgi:mannosyl-oligosaccharide alpha-1,3-glucosidase
MFRKVDSESKFTSKAWLERVIIYGYSSEPKSVKIEFSKNKQSEKLQFNHDAKNKVILIRKPNVNIDLDWSIIIE